jgi:hypothetical protein
LSGSIKDSAPSGFILSIRRGGFEARMTDIAAALANAEFECDKPSLSASQGSGLPRLACLSRRSRTRPTRRPLSRRQLDQQLVLTLDSAYEYTDTDLDHWDAEGPGSTFRKYYPEYHDLALSHGLDPALKPTKLDIPKTVLWLGYKPAYSLANLLSELAAFGDNGPPRFPEN